MTKENFLKTTEMLVALAFGVAYWLFDLHIATIVLIIGMTAFVVLVKSLGLKLTKLQLISWLAVLFLGGAAVFLKDESIIKWKPTVINAAVGLAFLATQFLGKKTLMQRLIEDKVPAPVGMLRRVNFSTGLFFLFLAVLNIVVAQNFSTTVWVNFKLFGVFILNLCFLGACLYYLRAYLSNLLPPENGSKN